MTTQNERMHFMDNLKAVLIILVVFGHALELIFWRHISPVYFFIYIFHMPLFAFCSGYMASYNPKKILTRLIGSYVIFQFLYVLFDRMVLEREGSLLLFTTPYWIMWYLLAMILWMLHLPLLDAVTNTKGRMALVICLTFALGIAAGFDNTLGYYMSLSRVIYFFPFFTLGFCAKKAMTGQTFQTVSRKWYVAGASAALTILIVFCLYEYREIIDVRWFWGVVSYERLAHTGYTYITRILLYLSAIVVSLFLMAIVPRRKTSFSSIGQRTMPSFLLHGFVILLLRHYAVTHDYRLAGENIGLSYAFLFVISLAMVLVFSALRFPLRRQVPPPEVKGEEALAE